MLFPLSLGVFGVSLGEKCSWSSYGFSWMFFIVLVIFLARTKRLGILIQKVFWLFTCFLLVMDDVNFSNNTHTYFTIHTIPITYNFPSPFQHTNLLTHTNTTHHYSLAGHSFKGSTFGTFMQLHKVLILLCICILTRKSHFSVKAQNH